MKIMISDVRVDDNVFNTYASSTHTYRMVADVFVCDQEVSAYQTIGLINLNKGRPYTINQGWKDKFEHLQKYCLNERGIRVGAIIDADIEISVANTDFETFVGHTPGNYTGRTLSRLSTKAINSVRKVLMGSKRLTPSIRKPSLMAGFYGQQLVEIRKEMEVSSKGLIVLEETEYYLLKLIDKYSKKNDDA